MGEEEARVAAPTLRPGSPGRTRLNPKGRSWCGPTALTVLTGHEYETCRTAIARITGKRAVTGVHENTLGEALRRLVPGASLTRFRSFYPHWRPTLAQFLARTRGERDPGTFYLVVQTTHFVVVRGRKAWDNSTPPEGVFLSRAPWRRARVRAVYALVSPGS